jgi:hypothetical protein
LRVERARTLGREANEALDARRMRTEA